MTVHSIVFTRPPNKHTSRPPRLQLVSSAPSVINALTKTRHLNSPGLTFQTHVGCVTIVWLAIVEEQKKSGPMLNQPSQQRTSRLQGNSRLLLQKVFEGSRKSVTCPLPLLSPLEMLQGQSRRARGRCSLLAFATFPFCPLASEQSSTRGDWGACGFPAAFF